MDLDDNIYFHYCYLSYLFLIFFLVHLNNRYRDYEYKIQLKSLLEICKKVNWIR